MSREEGRTEWSGAEVSPTEEAGETTAADMVSGPVDTRPVGADTTAKVADTPKDEKEADEG